MIALDVEPVPSCCAVSSCAANAAAQVAVGLPGWDDAQRTHLGEELADVLLYLVRLADKCAIDLPAAAQRKISRNGVKYPAALARGSAKKYTELAGLQTKHKVDPEKN